MLQDEIFKDKVPLTDELEKFGFVRSDVGEYVYVMTVLSGQFRLKVAVDAQGKVTSRVFDTDTGDEYVLYRAESAAGAFVGKVRTECCAVLEKIAAECFIGKAFKSSGAVAIIRHVKEKYGDKLEFLWANFPRNAVLRRQDNRKWYAAVLTVAQNKIGLAGDNIIEIVDVRMAPEDVAVRVDGQRIFHGYHMNKKHWVTLLLDGSMPEEELLALVDESYALAAKK